MPDEPEAHGLLALMLLHDSRRAARIRDGDLVLLADQDRSLWDHAAIAGAVSLLERAARMGRPGAYQLQAAIAACHAEARDFDDTDWAQILVLYDLLLAAAPSPIVRLHRAVAVAQVHGAAAALGELDELGQTLDSFHLLHAIRGRLLHELGDREQARAAQLRAAQLTMNTSEQALLRRRIELGS
jgi:RNA polymerase sigma-70 factor (ECF subfamily)